MFVVCVVMCVLLFLVVFKLLLCVSYLFEVLPCVSSRVCFCCCFLMFFFVCCYRVRCLFFRKHGSLLLCMLVVPFFCVCVLFVRAVLCVFVDVSFCV